MSSNGEEYSGNESAAPKNKCAIGKKDVLIVSDWTVAQARGSTLSYVQALETHLAAAEALLQQENIDGNSISNQNTSIMGIQLIRNEIHHLISPFLALHSDDLAFIDIQESFQTLSINNSEDPGFQGKSSDAMLMKATIDIKSRGKSPPKVVKSSSLVLLYFNNIHIFLPFLHRPTFEEAVNMQLHQRDDGFAKVLLLVCAIGS
ncbi:hypothetical protein B0H10DRAFT_1940523 [Mycena sp. CBHHK59/15]|nr:hypothetical protein B0H10DRAFT_1940523 [Mycena sp. CBHHK59/15]